MGSVTPLPRPALDGSRFGWPSERELPCLFGRYLGLGQTFQEHASNLAKVFSRLQEAGLRLKPSKCYLAKKEVKYLGYVVSHRGVAADQDKVEAVRNYPVPTDLKSLRSFLGLTTGDSYPDSLVLQNHCIHLPVRIQCLNGLKNAKFPLIN